MASSAVSDVAHSALLITTLTVDSPWYCCPSDVMCLFVLSCLSGHLVSYLEAKKITGLTLHTHALCCLMLPRVLRNRFSSLSGANIRIIMCLNNYMELVCTSYIWKTLVTTCQCFAYLISFLQAIILYCCVFYYYCVFYSYWRFLCIHGYIF